jgi:hypothetical protein
MLIRTTIPIYLRHGKVDPFTVLVRFGPIITIDVAQLAPEVTANLIIHMLSVDPKWLHPLPMDVASTIPNTGGVQVTPIEANHCSSVMLLSTEYYLDA